MGDHSAGLSAALSPNALAAVLASDAEKADPEIARRIAAVLDNQARVLHLQAEEMVREDSVRHWSLLVQYASGVMKVAFELAGALALTALAVVVAIAIYNAANEDGVIIEAFSVPSDLANRGITGQAVAAQILDRLSYMQSVTRSLRPAASYSNNWHNDIKVQIPNTGGRSAKHTGCSRLGSGTRPWLAAKSIALIPGSP